MRGNRGTAERAATRGIARTCADRTDGSAWKQAHAIVPGARADAIADALASRGASSVSVEDGGGHARASDVYRNGARHFGVDEDGRMRPVDANWRTCKVTALFPPHVSEARVARAFRDHVGAWDGRVADVATGGWLQAQVRSDQGDGCKRTTHERYGDALVVADPRADVVRHPRDVVVRVDGAMAFGTGAHPTTRLCLEWLEGTRRTWKDAHVMDFGCGTGVLGIAAMMLGAKGLHAIDIEEDAVHATRTNARRNGISDRHLVVELGKDGAAGPVHRDDDQGRGGAYDVVLANVLLPPLLENRRKLTRWVMPGGWICMSGILAEQTHELVQAYEDEFQHLTVQTDPQGKWARVVGVKKGP